MYAQIVSKNLTSILSYQSLICSRYFEKSTISLKHNSPILTFQKLFPFAGSTQRSKGKPPTNVPSLYNQIFGRIVMKSLWILFIHSLCGGNPHIEWGILGQTKYIPKTDFNVKRYKYKYIYANFYTTKATEINLRVFPQRRRPRDIAFVKCKLRLHNYDFHIVIHVGNSRPVVHVSVKH